MAPAQSFLLAYLSDTKAVATQDSTCITSPTLALLLMGCIQMLMLVNIRLHKQPLHAAAKQASGCNTSTSRAIVAHWWGAGRQSALTVYWRR
jgi:hypothetical protein